MKKLEKKFCEYCAINNCTNISMIPNLKVNLRGLPTSKESEKIARKTLKCSTISNDSFDVAFGATQPNNLECKFSGSMFHPRLLSVAITGVDGVGNNHERYQQVINSVNKINNFCDLKSSIIQGDRENIKKDIDISNSIINSFRKISSQQPKQIDDKLPNLMKQAIKRENQSKIEYVCIDNDNPEIISKKISTHQHNNPSADLEPIKLKSIYEDLNPLIDNRITNLQNQMILTQPVENPPDRIEFAVPKTSCDQNGDASMEFLHYVYISTMPLLLQRIIFGYVNLLYSDISPQNRSIDLKLLKKNVIEFNDEIQKIKS